MSNTIVIGIGVMVALLFMLFDRLDEEKHLLFKLLIIFVNMTFLMFIPLNLLDVDVTTIFYKIFLGFYVLFWAYVIYFISLGVLVKLGLIIPKESKGNKK